MTYRLTRVVLALLAMALMVGSGLAADPGIDLPNADDGSDPAGIRRRSQVSDQKKGSILVYNLYSSASTGGSNNNTRISITNTSASLGAAVHLFFVDGSSCSVADSFVCLTPNQTATFLASDVDPGVVGYILAVASNLDGDPVAFDHLIGDEFVKLDTGHQANLGAEAISVSILPLLVFPVEGTNGALVRLEFDGVS